jgi:hypothetical protein
MDVEVSKVIAVKKIILIASAKKGSEIPWYYRIAGKFRLYKIMPLAFMKRANFLAFGFLVLKAKMNKKY